MTNINLYICIKKLIILNIYTSNEKIKILKIDELDTSN